MYNHITVMAQAVEQAVEATPNWTLLGIIFGIMAIIAILLVIPSKDVEALEDKEKKSKPALKFDDLKAIEDKDDKEESVDKPRKSLAEIKVAKRAVVSEEKSKEELRELRKARRASAQTEKAIQKREVKEAEKSAKDAEKSSDDAVIVEEAEKEETQKVSVVAEEAEEKASEAEAETVAAVDESEPVSETPDSQILEMSGLAEAHDLSEEKSAEPNVQNSNEVMVDVTADTSDMFATLFGDDASHDSLSFDEIERGNPTSVDDGTIFPTLGSALIPLNEIEKAAEDKTEVVDALDELTRRLSDKAEKKTHQ